MGVRRKKRLTVTQGGGTHGEVYGTASSFRKRSFFPGLGGCDLRQARKDPRIVSPL